MLHRRIVAHRYGEVHQFRLGILAEIGGFEKLL